MQGWLPWTLARAKSFFGCRQEQRHELLGVLRMEEEVGDVASLADEGCEGHFALFAMLAKMVATVKGGGRRVAVIAAR